MMTDVEAMAVRDAVTLHFSQHQLEDGERLFRESESQLPEQVRLECLGNVHFYRREFQDAIRCYEAAIKLAPTNSISRFHYLAGVQHERIGNVVEAFKQYQAAIGVEPTFVDAYVELGGLLAKVEDFEGALKCYRDALQLDPSDVANYHNLKSVLEHLVRVDPEHYESELEATEMKYREVAKSGSLETRDSHKW